MNVGFVYNIYGWLTSIQTDYDLQLLEALLVMTSISIRIKGQ